MKVQFTSDKKSILVDMQLSDIAAIDAARTSLNPFEMVELTLMLGIDGDYTERSFYVFDTYAGFNLGVSQYTIDY